MPSGYTVSRPIDSSIDSSIDSPMDAAAPFFCRLLFVACIFCVSTAHSKEWITIDGGQFIMGDTTGDENEVRVKKSVKPFQLMRYEVTNRQFKAFVRETDYVTDVQRNGKAHVWTQRWQRNDKADYLHPHGKPLPSGMKDHPVLQVSARDAETYCEFHGARLPTEVEWEFAARGTDDRRFPWGNQSPKQTDSPMANFGTVACCAASDIDGYAKTSPVGSYPLGVSPFGIEDMAGNVWEWTSSPFPGKPEHRVIRGGGWGNNPYCLRASYRHGNPPDIGLNMVGIRCARDL